jgi:uncharacterized sodium:solute symporter family permease YidK
MILNPQQHDSWLIYAAVALGYTVFLIGWCYIKDSAPIFSKRNSRPIQMVIWAHLVSVVILLELTWFAIYIYPSLPDWLTNDGHGSTRSIFSCLVISGLVVFGFIERRWIYVEVESDSDDPTSEDNPS